MTCILYIQSIINLDEFRTSKLNCYNEEENSNLYLPDKSGELRKIHSILTYQMNRGTRQTEEWDVSIVIIMR